MSLQNKYELKEKSFQFDDEIDDNETTAYLNKVADEGWTLKVKQTVSGMKDDVFHIVVCYTHNRKKKEAKEIKEDGSSIYTS
jgi:hypothetical protein